MDIDEFCNLISESILDEYKIHLRIQANKNKDNTISYNVLYSNKTYVEKDITLLLCKTNLYGVFIKSSFRNILEKAKIKFLNDKNDQLFIPFDMFENYKCLFISDKIFNKLICQLFSFSTFGCCDRYIKCSDNKKCIHDDLLYSTACMYRKNLEQDKIFYGKNKNF